MRAFSTGVLLFAAVCTLLVPSAALRLDQEDSRLPEVRRRLGQALSFPLFALMGLVDGMAGRFALPFLEVTSQLLFGTTLLAGLLAGYPFALLILSPATGPSLLGHTSNMATMAAGGRGRMGPLDTALVVFLLATLVASFFFGWWQMSFWLWRWFG